MPINPNIALAVRPVEIADPLAMYGRVAAIQQAQNQNALAQYQLGAAQRAEAKDIARSNALAQAGADDAAIANALLRSGDLKGYTEFVKSSREAAKAEGDLIGQRLDLSKRGLENVTTPAEYLAWHEANHRDPVLGKYLASRGITAESSRANIEQKLSQPGGFEALMRGSALGLEKSMEQHFAEQNLGGSVRTIATPKYAMPGAPSQAIVVPGSEGQRTMAPGEAERIDLERQRVGLEGRRVGLEQRRVGLAEQEAQLKREGIEGIAPKELQKREAAHPAATQAIKGFETKSDSFIKDLEALRDHPGLGQITGIAAGRLPGLTAEGRAAQALYDKIVAKGGFQALQDLRDASKTGGALGNVSNQEGKQLTASFAAIDRRQDAPDVQAAINQAIGDIEGSKTRMREAYDATYAYRAAKQAPAAPTPPRLSPQDQEALNWANANPKDPRAAAIKQQLGAK